MGLWKDKKIIATIFNYQILFNFKVPLQTSTQSSFNVRVFPSKRACFSTTFVLKPIFPFRKAKDFQISTGSDLLNLS